MIVKDETPVIERCLASVKDVVNYYIIFDTGSTDGTQELIKKTMEGYGIPGEIHESEFVNFEHNRNEALECATNNENIDYVLFIDADEQLRYNDASMLSSLNADTCLIEKSYGPLRYKIPFMLNVKTKKWKWEGVVHEYVRPLDPPASTVFYPGGIILATVGEGVRSRGVSIEEKFLKDAELLEAEYEKNPDDLRSLFYLAQSYRDAGKLDKAIDAYDKRAQKEGWEEEKYYSQYQKGKLMLYSDNYVYDDAKKELLAAAQLRPQRSIESLYELAKYCRLKKRYREGCFYGQAALAFLRIPNDSLFIDKPVHDWRLKDEFSICLFWDSRIEESAMLMDELIHREDVPGNDRQRIFANMTHALNKIPKLVGLRQ